MEKLCKENKLETRVEEEIIEQIDAGTSIRLGDILNSLFFNLMVVEVITGKDREWVSRRW